MDHNKAYVDRAGILHLPKIQAQRSMVVPELGTKIEIEGLDKVIIADIKKHRNLKQLAEKDEVAFKQSQSTLSRRKIYYQATIKKMESGEEKRFNLNRMKEVVEEMRVEKRKLEDARSNAQDRIKHHGFIVTELENQLARDYGKAVTADGKVINVS